MSDDAGKGGDVGGAAGDVAAQLATALEQIGTLKGGMDTLKTASEGLERKLDEADRELLSDDYLNFKVAKTKGKGDGGDGGDGGKTTLDVNNLDGASNAELVAFIKNDYDGNMKNAVKELSGKISATDTALGAALAQIDVSLCQIRHPDFEENKDAIYKVAKINPSWGAEKCYSQWMMEAKVAADAKTQEDVKKAEEDRKILTEKGGGAPGSSTQEKELTETEAANLAYDGAFGNQEKA